MRCGERRAEPGGEAGGDGVCDPPAAAEHHEQQHEDDEREAGDRQQGDAGTRGPALGARAESLEAGGGVSVARAR